MNPSDSREDDDKTLVFLLLRFYFGIFWVLEFFGKVFDQASRTIAWRNMSVWAAHTTEWFVKETPLPAWSVAPYNLCLPYLELLIGLLLLIGLRTREVLVFSFLLMVSLNVGMLLIYKHDVVALNTVYLALILLALRGERHNRWTVDGFLRGRAPKP